MAKRANTWQDAYATGVAKLDLGDGIVVPLPVDGILPGEPGPPGAGVPAGGAAFQVVRKNSAGTTTEWVSPDKALVGLGSVDNTADATKPVSTAQAAALAGKVGTDVVSVTAGVSSLTDGDLVKVGRWAYIGRSDANMAIVQGGGDSGNENVIGGNLANVNTATSNLNGAPTLTGTDGNWCFIMNGYDNVANGWAIILNGFHNKVAQGGNHATIAGGSIHTIGNNNYSTIGGGTGHTIPDGASGSTVGGGITHTASGSSSTVGGGTTNTASGFHATVSGGGTNIASGGNGPVVAGGDGNTASGAGSVVPGGTGNTASGYHSTAGGRGSVSVSGGMRAYGAQFTAPGDAQDATVIMKRESTTATATGLSCDGSSGLVIPENTTWAISGLVVARRADVDGENAAWKFDAVLKRDTGNTAALVGTPTVTQIGANAGNTWALTIGSASAGNLNVTTTGEAAKTIRWVATLRIAHVSG